jgi:competence protein ComEA
MVKLFILLIMLVGALFASVDMNNADAKAFTALKGVGPKKAEAIILYRKSNGCFSNIDELVKVKGIGKKTLQKNRADLVLGKCKK